jgi:hypothetical protein
MENVVSRFLAVENSLDRYIPATTAKISEPNRIVNQKYLLKFFSYSFSHFWHLQFNAKSICVIPNPLRMAFESTPRFGYSHILDFLYFWSSFFHPISQAEGHFLFSGSLKYSSVLNLLHDRTGTSFPTV